MPKSIDPALRQHNFVDHLKNPYCKQQTKLQLAVTIIFHVIIFPLGLYRLGQIFYSFCCKRSAIPVGKQPDQIPLQKQATQSVKNNSNLEQVVRAPKPQSVRATVQTNTQVVMDDPAAVRQAKEFADVTLAFNAKEAFEPSEFTTGGPNHEKIERLRHLYRTKFNPALKRAIKENPVNPWETKAVQKAANEAMKISYAIAHYSLEDANSFTAKLTGSQANQTTLRKNFLKNRVLLCGKVYHFCKSRAVWSPEVNKTILPDQLTTKQKHIFHNPEHMENSWNVLYNDICTRMDRLLDTQSRIFLHFPSEMVKYITSDR
jgi:hypothetical protein